MPKYPKMDEDILKGRIANFINIKVIGRKAKEIREEKGIEPHELTRDFFTKEELIQIEKLQVFTEILISQFKLHDFQSLEERINLYEF
jgi:prolipoprotein diacylglyceryltransferase